MSAISVLHAPRDEALGQKIAQTLSRLGHDARPVSSIVDGGSLADDASIVIWSNAALRLAQLHEQAREALARGALIPVAVGGAGAPNGFEDLPPVDLSGWGGDEADPRWRFVLEEIEIAAERQQLHGGDMWVKVGGPSPAEAERAATAPAPPVWGRIHVTLAGAAAVFAVGAIAVMMATRFFSGRDVAADVDIPRAPDLAFVQPVELPETIETQDAGIEEAGPAAEFEITVTRDGNVVAAPAAEIAEETADAPAAEETAAAEDPQTDHDAMAVLVAAVTTAAAGEPFKDCEACPQMAPLPAGEFLMGAPASEPARQPTEGPVTSVAIAKPFAIGVTEVTFAEWEACVAGGGCRAYEPYDHGWGRGARPAINVSYEDAQSYAAWLSGETGQTYRLPSEAEWEYAARAGSAAPFSSGAAITPGQANFNGEYPYIGEAGTYRRRTTPVGSFAPNAFGLRDMNGNVWEWTADCWRETHAGAPANGSAVGGDCGVRVLKGGAWNTGGWRLRAGHRIGKNATAREFDNGFRVVREMN